VGLEIERRFLVKDPTVVDGASREIIVQGYAWAREGYAIRLRLTTQVDDTAPGGHPPPAERNAKATLAFKGPRIGAARVEYEWEIDDLESVQEALRRIEHKVSKSRYHVISEGETWDVDVFHGDNEGLIIAEIEMERSYAVRMPAWCAEEVTDLRKYDNENLATTPYRTWKGPL